MIEMEVRAVEVLESVRTNSGFDRSAIRAFGQRDRAKPMRASVQWRLWNTVWTYRRQIVSADGKERIGKDLVEFAGRHIGEIQKAEA